MVGSSTAMASRSAIPSDAELHPIRVRSTSIPNIFACLCCPLSPSDVSLDVTRLAKHPRLVPDAVAYSRRHLRVEIWSWHSTTPPSVEIQQWLGIGVCSLVLDIVAAISLCKSAFARLCQLLFLSESHWDGSRSNQVP